MCLSHLIYTLRPCLFHTCHAMPMPCSDHAVLLKATARPCCAVALRRTAWSEHGMASVNQTRPHSVYQIGKTHSKPLAAQHGRGTVWARHAMCESALKGSNGSYATGGMALRIIRRCQPHFCAKVGVHWERTT